MKSQTHRAIIVVSAAAALLSGAPAQAIIFHSTGDPSFNTTAPTGSLANSGWQYQGVNGMHLGTPVGPHHFLTAAHLGTPVGATFTYNGVTYTSVASQDFGDLRLFQVDKVFHSYAPLYDAITDGAESSKDAVVIGRGRTRGTAIKAATDAAGVIKGWNWGADTFVQRWGENRVTSIASYEQAGDNKLLKFNFDATGSGYVGVNEAHLAGNDSGGATFINVNGQWKLAGINYAVSGPYRLASDGADLFAALFDTRGFYDDDGALISGPSPLPSSWYASRVSASLPSLKTVLNLPPTWNLNASGNWTASTNWANGGVPNAVGAIADFRTVITADRTVTLNSAATVGTINFDSPARYTIAGSSTLTLNTLSGSAGINVASGSHTISAPLAVNDPLLLNVIPSVSTLRLTGNVTAGGQGVTKQGQGTAELKHLRAGAVAVTQGTLRIMPNGTSTATSKVTTITVSPGAKLDLADNRMAVTSGTLGSRTGSTYTGILGLLQTGRAGGSWSGSGIQSSSAADNDGLTAIGVALGSEVLGIGATQTATWSGQTVNGSTVLLRHTYAGDANLDGAINIDDYGQIDSSIGGSDFGWSNGDFNYDGSINIDDYGIIDSNIGRTGELALLNESLEMSHGVSAVPEPTWLGLGIFATAMLRRRRRR